MKPKLKTMKKYNVDVIRISYAFRTIEVLAESEKEAVMIADKQAGDLEFSEKNVEYKFPYGAIENKQ